MKIRINDRVEGLLFLTVSGGINGGGELLDFDFESLLDLFESFYVLLTTHEGDGETLGAESFSSSVNIENAI